MKLAAKMILVSVLAVIAVMGASNYFSAHFAFERIKKDHQQFAAKMADQMKQRIIDAWRKGGIDALQEYLSPQQTQPLARWVWFEKTVTETTKPRANAEFPEVLTRNETVSFVSITGKGSRNLYTYLRVDLGEPRLGGLEFTRTLEEHDRETREDFVEFLIAVGSMAVVSILMVWIAGVRMIARPLTRLTEATRRIGEGDFSGHVDLPGNDELSQLANSINEMSEHLEQQKQAIESETRHKLDAMRQLRHADRLKTVGRMAASIAHEIGTPLSVVSGRAALIRQGNLTDEKIRQNAETIQSETERISAMIRQVLDFARQAPTEKTAFDLNEVVVQTAKLLKPLAEKQQVEIKISLADQKAISNVDSVQIQQVLTNMVMNAIQSMNDGGILELDLTFRKAVLKSSKTRDYWVIAIKDQGCGIPPENLESIFEPFFTTKDIGKGTGLGLSIAYSIVEEQGGWIEVKSEVGRGSQFEVFLPVLKS